MEQKMSRILFAAPKSGSGKTMITCALIEIMKRRKLKVASMKCGPDYIDPMFHRRVLGIESGNLDTFFTDEETTRYLLAKRAEHADIVLLEGVMGYYDGLGGTSERASTYEIAKVTETPVILIVDGKGASVSLAAVIRGMIQYREDSRISGVILNRVSSGYYERLKQMIEEECGVEVLGYVPELECLTVPSRHLGLALPQEKDAFENWVCSAADAVERYVDVNALIAIADQAQPCMGRKPDFPRLSGKVRLAVARDEAFSFCYAENLSLLAQMGAELVYFSPLHDERLPEEIDGLLLPGGYPELYAKQLEKARVMRESVQNACRKGMPCLAECGGFLYLQEELEGEDGEKRKMTGVLSGEAYRTDQLLRFGYIEAESQTAGILGEAGQTLKGHEFHYWDCTENGSAFLAKKPAGGKEYSCMVHTASMAAGFPHFYYYSNPGMIYQFLMACQSFQAGRAAKAHWDSIAKPIDSLGLLEEHVVKICRINADPEPVDLRRRALIILCADHGVVQEGVTQTGSEVTQIVSENFAKGCSTVNYMAACAAADVYTVDIGMDTPPYEEKRLVQGAVIDRKIARGSGNIAKEPAMTIAQCRRAIETGMELVREFKEAGYRILATGEMGIGNTTPTSALAAIFLQLPAEAVVGKGAGLSAQGLCRKREVVAQIMERVQKSVLKKGLPKTQERTQSDESELHIGGFEALEVLAQAGGYEIAGMTGIFLGAVKYRIPVVIDGAISAVAALAASQMDPRAADFILASHESGEATGRLALERMGLPAVLHANMCLGEGSGAVALFPLLDMAMDVYRNMGTFTQYRIDPYTRFPQAE